ncbi:hypothetical protein DVA76_18485, partial [Acinetobacter baumannii]
KLNNTDTEQMKLSAETRIDVGLLQSMTSFWVKLFLITIYQRGELGFVVASDVMSKSFNIFFCL